ncbi:MAG: DUF4345 family protein [Anaerolineales bacterium]
MMLLIVIQVFILIATIGIGLLSFARPDAAAKFTGLGLPTSRGRTEMRVIFGGLFIGLGAAPLLFPGDGAYRTVALVYIALAASRTMAIVIDRSGDRSNWISLASELAFGFILLL